MFTLSCSKFISPEGPEFCWRYYKKKTFFSEHCRSLRDSLWGPNDEMTVVAIYFRCGEWLRFEEIIVSKSGAFFETQF